jgi:hypothetical protein
MLNTHNVVRLSVNEKGDAIKVPQPQKKFKDEARAMLYPLFDLSEQIEVVRHQKGPSSSDTIPRYPGRYPSSGHLRPASLVGDDRSLLRSLLGLSLPDLRLLVRPPCHPSIHRPRDAKGSTDRAGHASTAQPRPAAQTCFKTRGVDREWSRYRDDRQSIRGGELSVVEAGAGIQAFVVAEQWTLADGVLGRGEFQ